MIFFFSREKKHVSTMLSQACVSWAAKLTVSDRVWVRFKNQEKTPKENIYTSVVFLLSCNLVGITFADLIQQGVPVPVIRFYFRSNRFCYNAFVVVGSNCVLPVMSHTAFLVLWCGWVFFFFFFCTSASRVLSVNSVDPKINSKTIKMLLKTLLYFIETLRLQWLTDCGAQ